MINQYKLSLVLFGISILNDFEQNENIEDSDYFNKVVDTSSKCFAQMLFPINDLNKNLEIIS